jgi:prepilin-type N-terminal cleavage/methylation domain-containing protein
MRGFTLLETLVALVVLGLVVLGLTQGLRFGVNAWERQVREGARRDDLGATDRILRRLVEQAEPGHSGGEPMLQGSRGTMLVRSVLPGPSGLGVPQPVLAAIGIDVAQRLVLRVSGRGMPAAETPLLAGVDRMELAYWRDVSGWQDAWSGRDLPRLVRVRLVFNDPARHWPDILAAPMRERLE